MTTPLPEFRVHNRSRMLEEAVVRLYRRTEFLETGCWLWCGSVDKYGYGKFMLRTGRRKNYMTASRFSYLYHNGNIPTGLVVDHWCRNRLCVNPDHLRLLTNAQNVLCGEGISARNARSTHCVSGHLLGGDNLWVNPKNGQRGCRTCRRTRTRIYMLRRYYEKKRESSRV